MVTSWPLNTLSKDLSDNLQFVIMLRNFGMNQKLGMTKLMELNYSYQEINNFTQGNLDITGYYTNASRL